VRPVFRGSMITKLIGSILTCPIQLRLCQIQAVSLIFGIISFYLGFWLSIVYSVSLLGYVERRAASLGVKVEFAF